MNTDEGSPFIWRNASMLRAAATLVMILWVVAFSVIHFSNTWLLRVQAANVPDVPEYLMPGHPAPKQCDFQWRAYYPSSSFYCRNTVSNTLMYAEFSISKGTITRVSYSVANTTLGDLVVLWGEPTGFRQYSWGDIVFWGQRSVWASSGPFSPNSKVLLVSYSMDASEAHPWRGFVN
jgi:hypothetical protein